MLGQATDNLESAVREHRVLLHLSDAPTAPGTYSWLVGSTTRRSRGRLDCIPMVISTGPISHRRDEWAGVLSIPGKFSVLSRVGQSE